MSFTPGTWSDTRINLDITKALGPVYDVIDTVKDVLQLLITLLDIAVQVLEIVKAFLVGLLSPLIPLLEAIIAQIRAFFTSLKQLGVYLHGDLQNVTPSFENLQGGYPSYERRMLTRLIDTSDPGRPDFDANTSAIAIFFYLSADLSSVRLIVNLIEAFKGLFGLFGFNNNVLPVAADLRVQFNTGTLADLFSPLLDVRNSFDIDSAGLAKTNAQVSWALASPTSPANIPIVATLPPPAFLVEVSTRPTGLQLFIDKPISNGTGVQGDSGSIETREASPLFDERGDEIVLFGGYDQIDIPENYSPNAAISGGSFKPGSVRVYGQFSSADPGIIPIDQMKQGDKYIFQKSFLISDNSLLSILAGSRFTADLPLDLMPYDAEINVDSSGEVTLTPTIQPRSYFVRVRSLGADSAEPITLDSVKYTLTESSITKNKVKTVPNISALGRSSAPLNITFPYENTERVLKIVASALAVLLLSRSDLTPANYDTTANPDNAPLVGTGLEDIARILFPKLISNPEATFKVSGGSSPQAFREAIGTICVEYAQGLLKNSKLSDSTLQILENVGEVLLEWTWRDADDVGANLFPDTRILESLLSPSNESSGVFVNLFSLGVPEAQIINRLSLSTVGSPIQFFAGRGPFFKEQPSATRFINTDYSPVLIGSASTGPTVDLYSSRMAFIRNLFTPEIYSASIAVLSVFAGSELKSPLEGGWIALRLFPNSFDFIDELGDLILDYAEAFLDGLSGIAEAIVSYIEGIQQRILSLQALLRRIKALLGFLIDFQLPGFQALVVTTSNGTNGLVNGLLQAGNKPPDVGPDNYAGGFVLVAGGLPSALTDLILKILD